MIQTSVTNIKKYLLNMLSNVVKNNEIINVSTKYSNVRSVILKY